MILLGFLIKVYHLLRNIVTTTDCFIAVTVFSSATVTTSHLFTSYHLSSSPLSHVVIYSPPPSTLAPTPPATLYILCLSPPHESHFNNHSLSSTLIKIIIQKCTVSIVTLSPPQTVSSPSPFSPPPPLPPVISSPPFTSLLHLYLM
ncbi:hypothetical protein Rs2_41649 [Raphanus sativus]|nr:hypothetical protein Rs2_41649 [Raphanus sativus]